MSMFAVRQDHRVEGEEYGGVFVGGTAGSGVPRLGGVRLCPATGPLGGGRVRWRKGTSTRENINVNVNIKYREQQVGCWLKPPCRLHAVYDKMLLSALLQAGHGDQPQATDDKNRESAGGQHSGGRARLLQRDHACVCFGTGVVCHLGLAVGGGRGGGGVANAQDKAR